MIEAGAIATWVRAGSVNRRRVVLIDGGSGAGKSTLAEGLAGELGAQLVSLDWLYPDWSGLAAGALMVPGLITDRQPGYPTWDWTNHRSRVHNPGGWMEVDPTADLVIEGCGALTPANAQLATSTLWCELDAATRKQRALARDGDGFAPWWQHWADQEAHHWRAHRPWELAQLVVPMNEGSAQAWCRSGSR